MAIITFSKALNVSVQPGDTIYYCSVVSGQAGKNHPSTPTSVNTAVKKFGEVTNVDHGNKKITCTNPNNQSISGSHFVFFSKDRRANTSGIVGYFAETEYRNYSKLPAEIFATAANYVESSK